MKPLRRFQAFLLLLLCALASACASTGNNQAPSSPRADAVVVADDAAPQAAPSEPVATPESSAESSAEAPADTAMPAQAASADTADNDDAGSADAETDFAAIYGNADTGSAAPGVASIAAYDPWEKYNRRVHAFNGAVDRALARPLAQAYVSAVPRPIRTGIGNFFDNLGEPVTLVNSVLQGNPRGAANALGRFLLNSTIGIGGLIDMADKVKMPNRGEDFGQTMAVWGWRQSRYIEVPFLGPRTLRDLFGLAADTPLRPIQYLEDDKTRVFLQGVQAVDLRARLLAIESLGEGAVDEYALYRDIWLQRRNYQINQASQRKAKPPGADLPAYLLEDGIDDAKQDDAQPAAPTPAGS